MAAETRLITDNELEFVLSSAKGRHCVEVGAWVGGTTVELLNVCKSLVVVDHFRGQIEYGGEEAKTKCLSALGGKDLFNNFLSNLSHHSHADIPLAILKMPSIDAAELMRTSNRIADFVFIDAEHLYEYVLADIRNWLPVVEDGGIIAGHDYGNWQGVNDAVHEAFGETFKRGPGSIWHKEVMA